PGANPPRSRAERRLRPPGNGDASQVRNAHTGQLALRVVTNLADDEDGIAHRVDDRVLEADAEDPAHGRNVAEDELPSGRVAAPGRRQFPVAVEGGFGQHVELAFPDCGHRRQVDRVRTGSLQPAFGRAGRDGSVSGAEVTFLSLVHDTIAADGNRDLAPTSAGASLATRATDPARAALAAACASFGAARTSGQLFAARTPAEIPPVPPAPEPPSPEIGDESSVAQAITKKATAETSACRFEICNVPVPSSHPGRARPGPLRDEFHAIRNPKSTWNSSAR